ncbi:hypothetical protein [Pseudidiomarina homiensis]|uniref:hypothetical protein n=1 Tax=Pseudidiomarina homiensis TaxID=364198 RepID=UPI00215B5B1B|nr:hypothetical protein [Pseudidiomarina homiensis]
MVYPLALLLFSTPVVDAPSGRELEQQLASVSALRIEELAELKAAAEVRKLQHQLQVAQLAAQIAEVKPQPATRVIATENPLNTLKVMGVVGMDTQLRVWLQGDSRPYFVSVEVPGPNGLKLVRKGHQLTLVQGQWRRDIALTEVR